MIMADGKIEMEKILDKDRCTGCNACKSICPKGAITMVEDNEGFLFPVINQEKCINCGLCKKTCPILNTKNNKSFNKWYYAYNKNEQEVLSSSSGGIFSLLANSILDENGIVIGAMFDSNNKLKHVAITNEKDLSKLKGSKYLQSDLGNIFVYIKDNIKNNKILFVGTPCQVAGLKSFIKQDYNNLYCVDLVCHGVPSPKLFYKYINELEKEKNDKVINYNFRDKSTGWETYSNRISFKNKTPIIELASNNYYMNLFLSDVVLRKSCYNCNFKLGNKYSDITLGDFWGIKKKYPKIYNKKGVSAIIINTSKGQEIFEKIKENLIFKSCYKEDIIDGNLSLIESAGFSKKRECFFDDLDKLNMKELSHKYNNISLWRRIKHKIKNIVFRGKR